MSNPWNFLKQALKEGEFLHGSTRNFDEFAKGAKPNKWENPIGGTFLTKSPEVAKRFAFGQAGVIPSPEEIFLMAKERGMSVDDFLNKSLNDEMLFYANNSEGIPTRIERGDVRKLSKSEDSGIVFFDKKRGHDAPVIYKVQSDPYYTDITDPGNVLDMNIKPKTKADRTIIDLANSYKNDTSGYRFQMQGNYGLVPKAEALAEQITKKNKFDVVKMPDASESGFESYYHYNPDKLKILNKFMPAAAAIPKIQNPLDMLGQVYEKYNEAKNKVAQEIVKRADFSKMNPSEINKTASAWSMLADPINLIEGPVGYGLTATQLMSGK